MDLPRLLEILRERGLSIEVDGNGQPRLIGKPALATTKLLTAIKWHRSELIRMFAKSLPMEVKYGVGHVTRSVFPGDGWPAGGWWWRHVGDTVWQPIPGTPGEDHAADGFDWLSWSDDKFGTVELDRGTGTLVYGPPRGTQLRGVA